MLKNNDFVRQIDNADFVSLDIFDTAVYRVVKRPRDVFRFMEQQSRVKNFYENRKKASKIIRQKNKERGVFEITLDEIYQTLGKIDVSLSEEKLSFLKKLEIETEISVCRPNMEILNLFNELKRKKKKVVFTSDMYLPKETIEQILQKCGYVGYDCLFLSSQDKMIKTADSRFQNFLNTPSQKIIHIGDNYQTDYLEAKKAGINAFWYQYPHSSFVSSRLIKKLKTIDNLFSSCMQSMIEHKEMNNYWYSIGYQYTGPLLVAFSQWLNNESGTKTIKAFLARDGLIMKKVYDICYPTDKNTLYLLASRTLLEKSLSDKTYYHYLEHLGLIQKDFCIVDVGRSGTIQKNLVSLFSQEGINKHIQGYYVDLRADCPNMFGFYKNPSSKYKKFLDFLDFLFIAPDSLTIQLKQEKNEFIPQVLPPNQEEKIRQEIASFFHQGAVDFAKDMAPYLNTSLSKIDPNDLLDICSLYMKIERQDKQYLANITIPFGKQNEKQRYIIAPRWRIASILKHPWEFLKNYHKRMIK